MRKSIQVFDIFVQPHDQFTYYVRDGGFITSTSDLEYPYPLTSARKQDTITVPTYGIKEEELSNFFLDHGLALMEQTMSVKIYEANLFLARRKMDNGMMQTGLFMKEAIGDTHNTEVESYLNRMLQLRVFW